MVVFQLWQLILMTGNCTYSKTGLTDSMEQNILAAVRSSEPVVGPYEICFIFSQIPFYFFQIHFFPIKLNFILFYYYLKLSRLYFNG